MKSSTVLVFVVIGFPFLIAVFYKATSPVVVDVEPCLVFVSRSSPDPKSPRLEYTATGERVLVVSLSPQKSLEVEKLYSMRGVGGRFKEKFIEINGGVAIRVDRVDSRGDVYIGLGASDEVNKLLSLLCFDPSP